MNKWRMRLTAGASALALSGLGLLASAGAASATAAPGTTGAGSWSFDPGDGSNAIQLPSTSTSTTTSAAYQAQVQQPINADGSSVFSAKSRTIPVKYKVQKATTTRTTTTTTDAVYPGVLDSETAWPGSPPASPSYGALVYTPPAGATVADVSNLAADFTWQTGENHGGSMRWEINTPDGNIMIYYGDLNTSFQSGTDGSGVNMMLAADARFEASQLGHSSPPYDMLANILAAPAPGGGTIAGEPVNWINLTVDGGWGSPQKVQLSGVQETVKGVTSTYTPGTILGGSSTSSTTSPWVSTNSDPAWVYLYKTSGATPAQVVDENLVNTQGDTGGQFRAVDGMYMYNFPVSNLPDPSATYKIGISFHSDGSDPVGLVQFGTK
jgi:hypothetical protein